MRAHTWQAETVESVIAEVPGNDDVAGRGDDPPRVRSGIGGYALAAVATAALLPTAFSPSMFSLTFTPKFAVLLVVAAVGAVPLVCLARSSHITWAARAGIAFLVVGLISVLLSPSVDTGFFGLYDWGTAWLFWFGCAGAFAIGAKLKPEELTWAFGGIVVGAAINALTAIYQVGTHPSGALVLYQGGQADGMLGNPIHLEAILLGALALIAGRASTGANRRMWWPIVLILSASLELTLERAALPIMLVIMAASLVVYGLRRAAPFAVLTMVGYAASYVSGGSGLGARVTSGTSSTTYGTRLHIWHLALESLVHRPLVGVGPGEVLSAIAPHVSASFAAHLGVGTLPADSHDFLVEVLATTGILGFLAFLAWLGGAALKARGPFLACAVAILSVELIEPLNVGVTPVAFLALGAATVSLSGQSVGLAAFRWSGFGSAVAEASPAAVGDSTSRRSLSSGEDDVGSGPTTRVRPTRYGALVTAVLLVASLLLGSTMLAGDYYQYVSYKDVQPQAKIAAGKNANFLLPYWAQSAAAVAEGYLWASDFDSGGTAAVEHALNWYVTASQRDPADPTLAGEIGSLELQLGNRGAAQRENLHALQLDPWTYVALLGLGTIAMKDHDYNTSLYWYEQALKVSPADNDLKKLIASDKTHLAAT
jgi:O-antigen ligase